VPHKEIPEILVVMKRITYSGVKVFRFMTEFSVFGSSQPGDFVVGDAVKTCEKLKMTFVIGTVSSHFT